MKKAKIVSLFVIVAILTINLSGCFYTQIKIKGYTSAERFYTAGPFEYTEYSKYYYSDLDFIEKFKNHKKVKIVEENDIEILYGYFEHYILWISDCKFYDKFDFDYLSQIKEGDYFLIVDNSSSNEKYGSYDIYYLDVQNNIIYFFHDNI